MWPYAWTALFTSASCHHTLDCTPFAFLFFFFFVFGVGGLFVFLFFFIALYYGSQL